MKIKKAFVYILTLFLLSPAAFAQQEQNLMSGKYTLQELQNILIPQAQWTPFPRIDDREGWASADRKMMDEYIKNAETYLDFNWQTITATMSLLFIRTGNRGTYEAVSFQKRKVLGTLLLAEIAENKGRFVDQIINGVWSICEESWWGSPAHLPKREITGGLADVSNPFVDLFAAATGALLSWVDYFLGDSLDIISTHIRKRIYYEVNHRLMEPLMNQRFWWMGKKTNGRGPNNWNTWICSNWINSVLLLEKDDVRRATMIGKALQVLDEFINPYPHDGGCDEGPGIGTLLPRRFTTMFRCSISPVETLSVMCTTTNGSVTWDVLFFERKSAKSTFSILPMQDQGYMYRLQWFTDTEKTLKTRI